MYFHSCSEQNFIANWPPAFFSLACQEGEQHPACLAAAVELESRDSPFILHPVTILTSMFIKLGFSGSLAPFVKGWKSESRF